ncbi:cation channel sperm-associated protein subunit gamma 1-like [Limulus polyphemus]|uniref:Cation channel sperm-associated protein subunit gamma 1-like n=1 Tax=Limulus polyphemus TaxID=6850 RepID=A0ABM1T6P7_LIMPO|nr:cation channel sperm-associated protein subunit gamma 1-like [Limulus polyphemus]
MDFDNTSIMVSSQNEFQDIEFTKVTRLFDNMNGNICNTSRNRPYLKGIVVLHENMFLNTDKGIINIVNLRNDAKSDPVKSVVLESCVKYFAVPTFKSLELDTLVAVDVHSNVNIFKKEVYKDKEPVEFKPLVNSEGQSICEYLISSGSCEVLSTAVGGMTSEHLLSLVLYQPANSVDNEFWIVKYQGDTEQWEVINRIPNKLCPSSVSDNYEIVTYNSTKDCNITVILKGISFTALPALHIYLYGTHFIHSIDAGKTLFVLTDFYSKTLISVLTFSSEGYLGFITEDSQLWFGFIGEPYLKRLQPSPGWELFVTMKMKGRYFVNFIIDCSITGQLYKVDIYTNESNDVSLNRYIFPVGRVLMHQMFVDDFHLWSSIPDYSLTVASNKSEEDDAKYGQNGKPCSETHVVTFPVKCLYSKIYFEVDYLNVYTRMSDYTFSLPVTRTESNFHDENSLLKYQKQVQQLLEEKSKNMLETNYAGLFPDIFKEKQKELTNYKIEVPQNIIDISHRYCGFEMAVFKACFPDELKMLLLVHLIVFNSNKHC